MDCIFCQIAKKEIPSAIVYEDKSSLAFLDINPLNKGHTLVVPKSHFETIADIPDEELGSLAKTVKKVAMAVKKATGSPGINITQNNGRAAEQAIPHAHFHIIPRFEGDGIASSHKKRKYEDGEMEKVRKEIGRLV
jgi:histidine triad (HIT) family protein